MILVSEANTIDVLRHDFSTLVLNTTENGKKAIDELSALVDTIVSAIARNLG
jgi:hypothetical protein